MLRYLNVVTPTKRGKDQETRRLRRLLSDRNLMSVRLTQAKPCVFADFRDQRIQDGVRPCQYDLVLLRHAWNIARIEWGWSLSDNPISLIRMPKNNPPRERRLKEGEFDLLKAAAAKSRSWYVWPVVVLAIETAMRRGEILGLRWEHIDLDQRTAFLPMTKNGRSRQVPLSEAAIEQLSQVPGGSERPFPATEVAVRQAWDRLCVRAGIDDLTFHDLRHEAISAVLAMGDEIGDRFVEALAPKVRALKISQYDEPGVEMGPVITAESKARIENYIYQNEADGAKIVVDGRNLKLQGY